MNTKGILYVAVTLVATVVSPSGAQGGHKILVDAQAPDGGDGSAAKPFKTISAGLKAAKPGDTVAVRAGTYREQISVPSGAEGAPLTLMAEPGQRVIVSGYEPVTGWQPFRDKIFVTTLDWKPGDLMVGYTPQPIAHEPNEGWYTVESAGADRLVDAKHLAGRKDDLAGGHAQIFQRKGTIFYSLPITAQDDAAGSIACKADKPFLEPAAGDSYVLKNRLSLIDMPGEWAAEAQPDGKTFKLYFWPPDPEALKNTQVPHAARRLVFINRAKNVHVEGLEVTGSQDHGIEVGSSEDITVTRCVVHHNGQSGIGLRGISHATISNCLILDNYNGLTLASARDSVVEENEIAYNLGDGVDIAGDVSGRYGKPDGKETDTTSGIVVRRNYIHHHGLWGHPDNLQLYRGVRDIKFEDNVALGGGQGLMTEEVDGAQLTGNVFLSSAAFLIIFGHGNSNDWTMRGNTFGLPGYGIYSFTGKQYQAYDNVYIGGVRTVPTYAGDNNLYSIRFDAKASPGQEAKSLSADPMFRNVPKAHAVIVFDPENTADTVKARNDVSAWKVGDNLEFNWDGIARNITAINGQKVTFAPALPAKPLSNFALMVNWGDKTNFTLDTRLLPGSPAEKLGTIGSKIEIAAYQRGDFDGDGKRDLPDLPTDVKAGLPDPNHLIPPSF